MHADVGAELDQLLGVIALGIATHVAARHGVREACAPRSIRPRLREQPSFSGSQRASATDAGTPRLNVRVERDRGRGETCDRLSPR